MADKQLWQVTPVATDVKNDDGVIIGGQTAGTRYAPLTLIANYVHNLWAAFINAITPLKTSFASGDKFPVVNGSTATAMEADTLLELTAQNVLVNVAPEFVRSQPHYAGQVVTYEGLTYQYKVDRPANTDWNSSYVRQVKTSDLFENAITDESNIGFFESAENVTVGQTFNLTIPCRIKSDSTINVSLTGDALFLCVIRANYTDGTRSDLGYLSCDNSGTYKVSKDTKDITILRDGSFVTSGTSISAKIVCGLAEEIVLLRNDLGTLGTEVLEKIASGDNVIPSAAFDIDNYIDGVAFNSGSGFFSNGSGYALKNYFVLNKGKYVCNIPSAKAVIYYLNDSGVPVVLPYQSVSTISKKVSARIYVTSSEYLEELSLTAAEDIFLDVKENSEYSAMADSIGVYYENCSDASELVGFKELTNGYIQISDGRYYGSANYRTTNKMLLKKGCSVDVICYGTSSITNNGIYFYTTSGDYIGGYSFGTAGQSGSPISLINGNMYKIHISKDRFGEDVLFAISSVLTVVKNLSFVNKADVFLPNVAEDTQHDFSVVTIGELDANFQSPFEYKVYEDGILSPSSKGNENAQYKFEIPLSKDAYNIRFKFQITSDIYRSVVKNPVIFSCGQLFSANVTYVAPRQAYQNYTLDGVSKVSKFGTIVNGYYINGAHIGAVYDSHNFGEIAFSIKYVGNESTASVEGTANSFIVKKGSSQTEYSYSQYETVSELYEALKLDSDFELDFSEIENRRSEELLVFPEISLVNTNYSYLNNDRTTKYEYVDKAPFFVPYSVCEKWHQVEVVRIAGVNYCAVDGIITKTSVAVDTEKSVLVIGGQCNLRVKDFEISCSSQRDAEIKNFYDSVETIVSEVNPYIVIFEGHEMVNKTSDEYGYSSDKLGCSSDRINAVCSVCNALGYESVSLDDVVAYYKQGKTLPKRCFTFIFDDYNFGNFLVQKHRSCFTRNGLTAYLAVITNTDSPTPIEYAGETITSEKAIAIGKNAGFGFVSHSKGHWDMTAFKPSEYADKVMASIVAGDIFGIDPNIFVFPYGATNLYLQDTMKFLGLKCAIRTWNGSSSLNRLQSNLYCLNRIEIGNRMSWIDLEKCLV